MSPTSVHIIGSGLAGSEAAYFLAEKGIPVVLHEMRPQQLTEAHQTGECAELVCSNSLKSTSPTSAPGMLKKEMSLIGSLILEAAEFSKVPAGEALGVDRTAFSRFVTERLKSHPCITYQEGEVRAPFPNSVNLIATGPLTSPALTQWLMGETKRILAYHAMPSGSGPLLDHLTRPVTEDTDSGCYFYDAIAPIIDTQSIDFEKAFVANRYDKGVNEDEEGAYINCPLSQEEYNAFIDAILDAVKNGETVAPKSFEKEKFFQGCQPIEAIVATGRDSLRFGPMKPVGLTDPKTGKRPFAAVQLRTENLSKTAYNLVGFQTKLKYGAQQRIIRMIPALHRAEFLRLGSIHRNTYVCAPRVLNPDLSLKLNSTIYLAGQITGVEGYLESAASGLLAAIFISQRMRKLPHRAPPTHTALGALLAHVTASDPKNYQPNNIQFSLFNPTFFEGVEGLDKGQLREAMAKQAPLNIKNWMRECSTLFL